MRNRFRWAISEGDDFYTRAFDSSNLRRLMMQLFEKTTYVLIPQILFLLLSIVLFVWFLFIFFCRCCCSVLGKGLTDEIIVTKDNNKQADQKLRLKIQRERLDRK